MPGQSAEDIRLRKIVDEAIDSNATIATLKTDVAVLKTDVAGLKTDVTGLKTDMVSVKEELHRQAVLNEDRDHKMDLILEVVLATQSDLKALKTLQATVEDHAIRIEALEANSRSKRVRKPKDRI